MVPLEKDGTIAMFRFSDLLLPSERVDLSRWAIIACDQHTADRSYWQRVESWVGKEPSTLHMIVPEVYLGQDEEHVRTERAPGVMKQYLNDGTLRTVPQSAILVRRTLQSGELREGIVIALDLEEYDYRPEHAAAVRASEETIPARLPARMDLRRNAPLETPHVLVLYDDREQRIQSYLSRVRGTLPQLYTTKLMEGGGEIEGFQISASCEAGKELQALLEELPTRSPRTFAFATGDGNHSLAAAKEVWNEAKRHGAEQNDPRRWCLVELCNIYDPGLSVHPIHRLVVGDSTPLLDALIERYDGDFQPLTSHRDLSSRAEHLRQNELVFWGTDRQGVLTLANAPQLVVSAVDEALTRVTVEEVDYVHGTREVLHAATQRTGTALILPAILPEALFPIVARDGAMPRKAFSLGEARDKRYYLECRALTGTPPV